MNPPPLSVSLLKSQSRGPKFCFYYDLETWRCVSSKLRTEKQKPSWTTRNFSVKASSEQRLKCKACIKQILQTRSLANGLLISENEGPRFGISRICKKRGHSFFLVRWQYCNCRSVIKTVQAHRTTGWEKTRKTFSADDVCTHSFAEVPNVKKKKISHPLMCVTFCLLYK